MFKTVARAVAALTAVAAAPSMGGLIKHNGAFIENPTNFVSFDQLGSLPGNTAYNENGVSVSFVGTATSIGAYSMGQGNSFSQNGGGAGYTSIKLQSAAAFDSIQFLASANSTYAYSYLNFQALLNGEVIETGSFGAAPRWWYYQTEPAAIFGLSGAMFDELRIQASVVSYWIATYPGSLNIDSISFGGVVSNSVPEPGTLLLSALGIACLGARRRFRLR